MAVGRQHFIFKIVFSLLLSGFVSVPNASCNPTTNPRGSAAAEDQSPYAYLAMNALGFTEADGDRVRRRLEMSWFGIEDNDGEKARVQLLTGSPDDSGSVAVDILAQDYPGGYYTTDIELPTLTMEELGYNSRCVFPYWIVIVGSETGEQLTTPRCLQSEPTWMYDNYELFKDITLGDLMLVYAHDAAAYKHYEFKGDDNFATLLTFAQEQELGQQLQWGARHLDIRVSYYPTTPERFWLNHGFSKAHPLSEGLETVRRYLSNTQDIVIFRVSTMDFGFTKNFPEEAYEEFDNLLVEAFGDWWVKPDAGGGYAMRLADIWSQPGLNEGEGRVFITYKYDQFDPTLHLEDIPSYWGNLRDPELMKPHIDSSIADAEANGSYNYIIQCQMTPEKVSDVLGDNWTGGLREMADAVNRNVTQWFVTDYADLYHVHTAHDHLLSTDMVRVSIDRSVEFATMVSED